MAALDTIDSGIPWRLILAPSFDLSERYGNLEAANNVSIEVSQNLPGKIDLTYPMDAEYSNLIEPYKTAIIAERFNWRATKARHNSGLYGEVWDKIWSGYVLPIKEDWNTGITTLSCVGWLQRLNRRITRQKLVFNSMDDGEIILNLLQHVNKLTGNTAEHGVGVGTATMADSYVIRWNSSSDPNTSTWMKYGGKQPNEGIGGATAYMPQIRTLTVEAYSQVLPHINNLMEMENGCDIHVDPVTRAFTVHRRYRRVKSDVLVGYQWGPENVSHFDKQIDADRKINYILATGAAGSEARFADDEDDMSEIGPIEEMQNIGNVMNTDSIAAYAGAELLVRKDGIITYGITPFSYNPNSGTSEPFVDFREGDQIKLVAQRKNRDLVSTEVRLFGLKVTLDGNIEKLGQLQVSP